MTAALPDQRSYWDEAAAGRTFTHELGDDFLAVLNLRSRILDYGCGYGRSVAELAGRGFANTVGVDFSREMIARGRRQFPALDLRHVDRVTVDEPVGSFDAAMLLAVLTCIVEDAAQATVLAEVRRLLRPGGLLFISDMPLQDDARNRARYDAAKSGLYGVFATGDGALVRHHDEPSMDRWLDGFELASRRRVTTNTMNGHTVTGIQIVARRP